MVKMSELARRSKEELSEGLNELIGTNNINFTKLTKSDLIQLYQVLSKLLKPISEMSIREILDDLFGNKPLRERAIFPRARKRIREFLKRAGEEGEPEK